MQIMVKKTKPTKMYQNYYIFIYYLYKIILNNIIIIDKKIYQIEDVEQNFIFTFCISNLVLNLTYNNDQVILLLSKKKYM
jgi:hypothetical protein